MRIKGNPRASPEQVRRLAKKDRGAALAHPCCPKDILLERPSEVEAVLASPAYGLLCIVDPQACEDYLGWVEQDRALVRLGELARRTDKPRLILWGLDLLSRESHRYRDYVAPGYDEADCVIRRWLYRRTLGITPDKAHVPWQARYIRSSAARAESLGHGSVEGYLMALEVLVRYAISKEDGHHTEMIAAYLAAEGQRPAVSGKKLHQYADRLEDYTDRRVVWAERALAKAVAF